MILNISLGIMGCLGILGVYNVVYNTVHVGPFFSLNGTAKAGLICLLILLYRLGV